MKNLKVKKGDLIVSSARKAELVYGEEKLIQDLSHWLLEPLGTGFTTPGFGSILYRFIGTARSERLQIEAENEVERILALYQADQIQKVKGAQLSNRLFIFSKKEILADIMRVESAFDMDMVRIKAFIKTAANTGLDIMTLLNASEGE
jgi:phage baseplate assembly protein W